jgi:hypothetical protein
MTKSSQYLKNSIKLVLSLAVLLSSFYGCTTSTIPTYSKTSIEESLKNILKDEYKLDIVPKLVGQTLWIFLPLDEIFEKAEKPEKYTERFQVVENDGSVKLNQLRIDYLVKAVPEKKKTQEYRISKPAIEKINNVWVALRRVIFSMDRKNRGEIKFYYLIAADIKNGFEITELLYYEDLIKVSYRFISVTEYQHRVSYNTVVSLKIIGDKQGKHLNFRDITWKDFLITQIKHRITLKFGKPEVEQSADIDKEISKIISDTLMIYGAKGIDRVELINLYTNKSIFLNPADFSPKPRN